MSERDDIVTNDPQNQAKTTSKSEAIAKIKEMREALKRAEAKTGSSGAMPQSPSAMILDAEDVKEMHPDSRLRWVSITKAARRLAMGYVRIPEAELPQGFGPAQKGQLILMKLPREVYEQRVEEIKRVTRERLTAHNREAEEVAEGLAKMARDQYGVSLRAEDILLRG